MRHSLNPSYLTAPMYILRFYFRYFEPKNALVIASLFKTHSLPLCCDPLLKRNCEKKNVRQTVQYP